MVRNEAATIFTMFMSMNAGRHNCPRSVSAHAAPQRHVAGLVNHSFSLGLLVTPPGSMFPMAAIDLVEIARRPPHHEDEGKLAVIHSGWTIFNMANARFSACASDKPWLSINVLARRKVIASSATI
jgi:hypothetical protein